MLTNIYESLLYFTYCCFVITLGLNVNKKLYQNVKVEEHLEKGKVVQRMLKTFAIVQCTGWPAIITLAFLLKINKESLDVLEMYWVHTGIKVLRAMYTLINSYVGFNSLIIAATRYTFIIYGHVAETIGIQKLRNTFLSASVLVPIFISLLNESVNPVEETWLSLFMPNYSYSFERNDDQFFINGTTPTTKISPLLEFNEDLFPSYITYGMKVTLFIMVVSTFSNILEGIIYLHIYIFYYRLAFTAI